MSDTPRGPVGQLPLTLQQSMERYFGENPCLGQGDLRAAITLESLQRTEMQDYWVIDRKRLSRADIMELSLDMVASGYSIPALLQITGMPKARTFMTWMVEYKPFADLMETAEKMRAIILSEQALEIMDGNTDPKMAFRDKTRADLRMRMAEVFNAKKFGKKQMVDVTHHLDDLASPEIWSRFRSILISHQAMIETNTGIKIEVPIQDAEIVSEETTADPGYQDIETLGFAGAADPAKEQE